EEAHAPLPDLADALPARRPARPVLRRLHERAVALVVRRRDQVEAHALLRGPRQSSPAGRPAARGAVRSAARTTGLSGTPARRARRRAPATRSRDSARS